jgi:hypothetical protein
MTAGAFSFAGRVQGDELWELVDRLACLDDSPWTFFVQSAHPRTDRGGSHQEMPSRLRSRPATGRTQLEDGQALGWRIVRPALCWNPKHTTVFNSHLLLEQSQLLPESVVLLLEADAGVPTVCCPTACIGKREVCQGDSVQDSGANPARPLLGQGNPGASGIAEHQSLRKRNPQLIRGRLR